MRVLFWKTNMQNIAQIQESRIIIINLWSINYIELLSLGAPTHLDEEFINFRCFININL